MKPTYEQLEASIAAKDSALRMVEERWTFDNGQRHTHTWHDWADCRVAMQQALAPNPGAALVERLRKAEEANEKFSLELANGTIALRQMTDSNLATLSRCRELEGALRFIRDECDWKSTDAMGGGDDRIGPACTEALSSHSQAERNGGKMSFPEMLKAAEADPSFREEYERLTGKRYEPSERESVAKEIADGLAEALNDAKDWIGVYEFPDWVEEKVNAALAAYRSAQAIGGRVE